MPRLCRQHALKRLEHRIENDLIGLGPTGQKIDIRRRAAAQRPDLLRRALAIGVRPIAGQALQIRIRQAAEHRRVRPRDIITFKRYHFPSPSTAVRRIVRYLALFHSMPHVCCGSQAQQPLGIAAQDFILLRPGQRQRLDLGDTGGLVCPRAVGAK